MTTFKDPKKEAKVRVLVDALWNAHIIGKNKLSVEERAKELESKGFDFPWPNSTVKNHGRIRYRTRDYIRRLMSDVKIVFAKEHPGWAVTTYTYDGFATVTSDTDRGVIAEIPRFRQARKKDEVTYESLNSLIRMNPMSSYNQQRLLAELDAAQNHDKISKEMFEKVVLNIKKYLGND